MPPRNTWLTILLLLLTITGCSGPRRYFSTVIFPPARTPQPPSAPLGCAPGQIQALKSLGYSIQVGAFANPDNATRLAAQLENQGIDAYAFFHESGLYKVRFGDHDTYAAARSEAETLQKQGLIEFFFIVRPEDNAVERIRRSGRGDLREELVSTAHRFIGIPYNWGGTTVDDGFDCSGLTMVTYRLNGLKLPRTSRDQFCAGQAVDKTKLQKGDLVFFATSGGQKISHVGLYIGRGNFIHAPRRGKDVRVTSLDNTYYQKRYIGARSYF